MIWFAIVMIGGLLITRKLESVQAEEWEEREYIRIMADRSRKRAIRNGTMMPKRRSDRGCCMIKV